MPGSRPPAILIKFKNLAVFNASARLIPFSQNGIWRGIIGKDYFKRNFFRGGLSMQYFDQVADIVIINRNKNGKHTCRLAKILMHFYPFVLLITLFGHRFSWF